MLIRLHAVLVSVACDFTRRAPALRPGNMNIIRINIPILVTMTLMLPLPLPVTPGITSTPPARTNSSPRRLQAELTALQPDTLSYNETL